MLKTLKNQFRAITKNKASLATNIIGLSIGLATTILLVVFILHEWSYDRHFAKADNIYRLHSIWIDNGNASIQPINVRKTFTEIPQQVPGIEKAVQIYRGWKTEISFNNTRFANNNLLYADSTFFELFDFKTIEGETQRLLMNPNSLVLTETTAFKIFGKQSAIDQVLQMNGKPFTVSAVIEDVPVNTHFTFDVLAPMNSLGPVLSQMQGLEFFTYYLYKPNVDAASVSNTICASNTKIMEEQFKSFNSTFSSEVIPLKQIHLYSKSGYDLGHQGNVKTVILVGIIAFLVLFLALTNFVNLFIIEGEQRAKEIGVRKVNGAGKASIIKQFFAETSLVVAVAFFIGTVIAVILLPQFGNLMQRDFSFNLLKSPLFILTLLGIFVITVLLSGSYPAFYLSKFNPVSILKTQAGKRSRKKYVMNLAGGLQIGITIFLITYLFGINTQVKYLKNLSTGFNPKGLVNIYNLNDNIKNHYSSIRDQLLKLPEVEGVAASSHTIGGGCSGQGIRLVESPENEVKPMNEYRIQPGLCDLLGLVLTEGRFFDPERESDRNGVILNEAAVELLGLTNPTGRKVVMVGRELEILGVVKNFHYASAAKTVQPLALTAYSRAMNTIMVRISPNADFTSTLSKIENTLKTFDSGYILDARNTQDIYDDYYAGEDRLEQLTRLGATLSVIIVMMGIFMLVSQSIARRTKEIGIRKVLGGSTTKMIGLIYSNSLKWTLIASCIAIPLSYFFLQNWLQNFVVKASLGWWLFIEGTAIIIALETLITFAQTWQAANRNPVDALRYE